MNRRGGERILSFYWFIMFVIVAIGVVSGVLMFFSSPLDVREIEANLLADKIIGCFSENGLLQNPDSVEDCNLILDETEFFVEVLVDGQKKILFGDQGFRAFCGHEGSTRNIPICVERKLFVLDKSFDGEKFVELNVRSIVAKIKENQR